ncbi:AbrB/MazE/SpoVT family DNA-binding domain-containing protein [Paenibacillus tritici]|uniref:AbrB/MazE/SpoVT family DNA-binding domain-containing protein n=1 Tax=Paenibacillus tritici TaxID=1873425 RepID=A0ABX2DL11_9BACL|nr:AbrB/MazE/SpoVT family DNA-binding domain-containing protein [Paenibacillus tritici]NQX45315.1 AbrB/MazE/SpoVT family DNA-binding domain-containing protein [Paenibacillus tritici]
MKATGIVRRIDDLGRVVLPKELRRTLGIAEGDPLEVFVSGDSIMLKKYNPGCTLCSSSEEIEYLSGKPICRACVTRIVKLQPVAANENHL